MKYAADEAENVGLDVAHKNLLIAVLARAVSDAVFDYFHNSFHYEKERGEAIDFLCARSTEPFSAYWILAHLTDDAAAVHEQLIRNLQKVMEETNGKGIKPDRDMGGVVDVLRCILH